MRLESLFICSFELNLLRFEDDMCALTIILCRFKTWWKIWFNIPYINTEFIYHCYDYGLYDMQQVVRTEFPLMKSVFISTCCGGRARGDVGAACAGLFCWSWFRPDETVPQELPARHSDSAGLRAAVELQQGCPTYTRQSPHGGKSSKPSDA